ncbi:MAG TPA: hypothetical protein PKV77_06205, partial [Bacteroidales bacterium]|nr:hypothetical protein [Bacteroidales bacterium]
LSARLPRNTSHASPAGLSYHIISFASGMVFMTEEHADKAGNAAKEPIISDFMILFDPLTCSLGNQTPGDYLLN